MSSRCSFFIASMAISACSKHASARSGAVLESSRACLFGKASESFVYGLAWAMLCEPFAPLNADFEGTTRHDPARFNVNPKQFFYGFLCINPLAQVAFRASCSSPSIFSVAVGTAPTSVLAKHHNSPRFCPLFPCPKVRPHRGERVHSLSLSWEHRRHSRRRQERISRQAKARDGISFQDQATTEGHHRIGDFAGALLQHHILDLAHRLPVGVEHGSPLHFAGGNQCRRFIGRFYVPPS